MNTTIQEQFSNPDNKLEYKRILSIIEFTNELMNQRINESTNQRINESTNQRINRSTDQRIGELANKRIGE